MVADAKHTPEPWVVGRYSGGIYGPDDVIVASMTTPSGYISNYDANARRIVACVNACEGIPTEALEAGVVRELVEALEVLVDELEWEIGEEKWGRDPDALPMARAVLAKVWGEAS